MVYKGPDPVGKMEIPAYKGYEYTAWLRRDGKISYNGSLFETPTAAAKKAVKRVVNGWHFWKHRDAKGEWVPLASIR